MSGFLIQTSIANVTYRTPDQRATKIQVMRMVHGEALTYGRGRANQRNCPPVGERGGRAK